MPKPIPEGYHSVTPYLIVDDANAAIKFYERAFGAKEKFRLPMGNRVGHAELEVGDSIVMLADATKESLPRCFRQPEREIATRIEIDGLLNNDLVVRNEVVGQQQCWD